MNKILKGSIFALSLLTMASCGSSNGESSKVSPVVSDNNNSESTGIKDENSTVYPLTLTTYNSSSQEISQTYTKAPSRVIVGSLSSAETLIALGLKDKIIGMVNPDNKVTGEYADDVNSLTMLGDKKTISHETILNQDPDFIFGRCSSFAISQSGGVAKAGNFGTPEELNKLDISMYAQKASVSKKIVSLSDVITDVRNIGKIFDVQVKANEYADSLQSKLNSINEKVAAVNISTTGNYKNALIMTGYGKKDVASAETYGVFKSQLQENMLNSIGYTNYYGPELSGVSYTVETLNVQNPDLIIYVTSDRNAAKDEVAVDLMTNNSALQDVPAIKNKKIIKVNYDDFMDYGPRTINTLETIFNFAYGE